MSMIQVSHLTFGYDNHYENIFDDVSFQLDTDWKLGFTGRNGRGKTTFLNLLMGKYPYSGTISASVEFSYFPFPVADPSDQTADVLAAVCPGAAQWEIQRELSLLELDEGVLYRPFETLSNGERTKTLLAGLFLRDNRFLLIDEPTNHLDMDARALVSRYLNKKSGFILVSHDRAFLDGCIDHVLSINRTTIDVQKGTFSTWLANKEARDRSEQAQNDRLQKDIRKLTQSAARAAQWSDCVEQSKYGNRGADKGFIGHKAAKMMRRSKNLEARRQQAADEKAQLLHDVETADALALHPLPYHSNVLAEANGLSVYYDGSEVTHGVRFQLERGDRMALCGKNGTGKSSVLKLLAGQDIPHTGTLRIGSGLTVSYVPQDASFLTGSLHGFAQAEGLDEPLFLAILRKLDFARTQFEKDMAYFSEGQRKKVLLARSLCQRAHVYIWDEPLNFIDVVSRMQLETLLETYRPTMVFVEHDSAFFHRIATKIVRL